MSRRRELQQKLTDVLGGGKVYFQPPESVKLTYPCIVYSLSDIEPQYADDKTYRLHDKYQVTLITKDPDQDKVREFLLSLPSCRFDRRFVNDNLYHDVFDIYY